MTIRYTVKAVQDYIQQLEKNELLLLALLKLYPMKRKLFIVIAARKLQTINRRRFTRKTNYAILNRWMFRVLFSCQNFHCISMRKLFCVITWQPVMSVTLFRQPLHQLSYRVLLTCHHESPLKNIYKVRLITVLRSVISTEYRKFRILWRNLTIVTI